MKHLTPEDKQYILRRHQEGASLRAIGREIGRPAITVRRTLEVLGIEFGPPQTSNKRSSPETEALVVRLYDEGRTWAEIMKQSRIADSTLSKILRRNNREFNRKPEGAEGKTELITALYETDHSARAIGRMLGHSKSTIINVITGSGGKIREAPGCENPDFFDQVDTPGKAYWLGFISADGCIITTARHPGGDHLNVKLAIGDRGHLVKLKLALGANASVTTGVQKRDQYRNPKGYASLSVGSRRLTGALLKLGILPRKSPILEPWDGPENLMPYYWCGLFDGDGSIAHKSGDLYTAFLCGSEACVRKFTEWAREICGTKATPYFRNGCWYVSISGRHQVPKLFMALYGNVPWALERKKALADSIIIR
jgi:hypothetical protein